MTGMNRRHFLSSLSALSVGMLLDPERALWVPGRRTYFDIVRAFPHMPLMAIEYDDGTFHLTTAKDPMSPPTLSAYDFRMLSNGWIEIV